jgi:hypothetical protein
MEMCGWRSNFVPFPVLSGNGLTAVILPARGMINI